MKNLSRYINKVPVKVELDTSMEKILAIQLLYKQVIDVMDTIEEGGIINVQSDWNAEAGSEAEILNKPTQVSVFENDANYVDADDLAEEVLRTNNFAAIMSLAIDPNAGVTISTTNPEWKLVLTDNEDRILLGKRQDNTWYFATDLDTILDTIIAGYGT
jgi:hypothetical protein